MNYIQAYFSAGHS